MTREEAIEILKAHHMWTGEPQEIIDVRKENKALEMAIQALSQEPCDDAISRQAAIEAVSEGCQELRGLYGRCEELINALPSVTHKSGKWINKDIRKEEYVLTGKCSVCGQVRVIDKFCSHCGAKMESEDKE